MNAAAARAAALLALPFVLSCEDGAGPEGDVSDFTVQVYVEVNDTLGMGASDVPVSALVTVTSTFDDLVLSEETGADGVVTFADLPAGAYVVSHEVVAAPDGAELQGSASQTVVAPFIGGAVTTRFVYAFLPGALSGIIYRDEDGSGAYEEGIDSVFRDVAILLFEGSDTLGALAASDTTDDAGRYDLGDLADGGYTLLVRAPEGTTAVGANPRPITVAPGEPAVLDIAMFGDPTGEVITIADARAHALNDTVKVRGVVTAGQGTYRDDSFYVQDASGGIFVFGVDPALGFGVGDSLQVIGRRGESREEALLIAIAVAPLGAGDVPAPDSIGAGDINAGLFQGRLGRLIATVDSIAPGFGGFEVWVHDEADDSAQVFVDDDTAIPQATFMLDSAYTITGIVATYDDDNDGVIEFGDYRLMPRTTADVE